MKTLLSICIFALAAGSATAQRFTLSDIRSEPSLCPYRIDAIVSDYSPTVRFDYEIQSDCPDGLADVGIRISYVRIDRFRNALQQLVPLYEQWINDDHGYGQTKADVRLPRADVYIYSDRDWIIKNRVDMEAWFAAENDRRILVFRTEPFTIDASGIEYGSQIHFNNMEELMNFVTLFDPGLTVDYAELSRRRNRQLARAF